MKTVGVIGFGRFGELLAALMKKDFSITIVEQNAERKQAAQAAGYNVAELKNIASLDILIFAVPISAIEKTLIEASRYVSENQLVLDICSVKVYPANAMKKYMSHCQLIATHPMFGPDSASNGLSGLQVAICPLTSDEDNTQLIVDFWQKLGVTIIMTTPEAHDKDAAYSQAFSYSVAKIILGADIGKVKLRTRSFDALMKVAELSANDSDQLFHDMLYYNPYYKDMKVKLLASMAAASQKLEEIEKEQDVTKIFMADI